MIKQISKDILEAAKSGNQLKRDLLRLVKGTLDQVGNNPTNEEILSVIKKMIKSNNLTMESMISTAPKESWTEDWNVSFQKLKEENEILQEYLPKEIAESNLKNILSEIDLKSAKSHGQALGMAIKFLKSRDLVANPDMVKSLVESIRG